MASKTGQQETADAPGQAQGDAIPDNRDEHDQLVQYEMADGQVPVQAAGQEGDGSVRELVTGCTKLLTGRYETKRRPTK